MVGTSLTAGLGLDPEEAYGKVRDEVKGEGSAGAGEDGK